MSLKHCCCPPVISLPFEPRVTAWAINGSTGKLDWARNLGTRVSPGNTHTMATGNLYANRNQLLLNVRPDLQIGATGYVRTRGDARPQNGLIQIYKPDGTAYGICHPFEGTPTASSTKTRLEVWKIDSDYGSEHIRTFTIPFQGSELTTLMLNNLSDRVLYGFTDLLVDETPVFDLSRSWTGTQVVNTENERIVLGLSRLVVGEDPDAQICGFGVSPTIISLSGLFPVVGNVPLMYFKRLFLRSDNGILSSYDPFTDMRLCSWDASGGSFSGFVHYGTPREVHALHAGGDHVLYFRQATSTSKPVLTLVDAMTMAVVWSVDWPGSTSSGYVNFWTRLHQQLIHEGVLYLPTGAVDLATGSYLWERTATPISARIYYNRHTKQIICSSNGEVLLSSLGG